MGHTQSLSWLLYTHFLSFLLLKKNLFWIRYNWNTRTKSYHFYTTTIPPGLIARVCVCVELWRIWSWIIQILHTWHGLKWHVREIASCNPFKYKGYLTTAVLQQFNSGILFRDRLDFQRQQRGSSWEKDITHFFQTRPELFVCVSVYMQSALMCKCINKSITFGIIFITKRLFCQISAVETGKK